MPIHSLLLSIALGIQPLPDGYLAAHTCTLAMTVLDGGDGTAGAVRRLHEFGAAALPSVREAMAGHQVDSLTSVPLLEFLAVYGDANSHTMIRPLVYSLEPSVAALATRALISTSGARAVPILENILSGGAPFGQKLAALEGLEQARLKSSFELLTRYTEDDGNDPILRAEAARIVAGLDVKKTRKWLKKLSLPSTTNPFLRERIAGLTTELWDERHD